MVSVSRGAVNVRAVVEVRVGMGIFIGVGVGVADVVSGGTTQRLVSARAEPPY